MKIKIFVLTLTSIMLHANDSARAERIKELEQLQFEYEKKISDLSNQLLQGAKKQTLAQKIPTSVTAAR